jgi:RNA recognition motif-containing protein
MSNNSKLFISNLNYNATEEDLIGLFSEKGEVVSFRLIKDRFSGRSKGFGFMEMANAEEAERALEELNGLEFLQRPLVVKFQRDDEGGPRGAAPGGQRRSFDRGGRAPAHQGGGGGGGWDNRY